MKFLTKWLCVVVLVGCAADAPEGSFVQDETGIVVTPAQAGIAHAFACRSRPIASCV